MFCLGWSYAYCGRNPWLYNLTKEKKAERKGVISLEKNNIFVVYVLVPMAMLL